MIRCKLSAVSQARKTGTYLQTLLLVLDFKLIGPLTSIDDKNRVHATNLAGFQCDRNEPLACAMCDVRGNGGYLITTKQK